METEIIINNRSRKRPTFYEGFTEWSAKVSRKILLLSRPLKACRFLCANPVKNRQTQGKCYPFPNLLDSSLSDSEISGFLLFLYVGGLIIIGNATESPAYPLTHLGLSLADAYQEELRNFFNKRSRNSQSSNLETLTSETPQ